MKREPILLLLTVLLLALMGWGLAGDPTTAKTVRPRNKSLDLPELGGLDPVVALGAGARARDPWREPREVEPLPPLQLPPPPLAELAVLMPPPVPDAGPAFWSRSLLVEPPTLPGGIDELVDTGTELDGADEGATPLDELGDDADFATQYDQLRLANGWSVLWGRILDENRYELVAGEDTVHFQEVDPRTGEDRFAAQEYAPGQYEDFEFARTLRNEVELAVRALDRSAGAIRERIEFVQWLLDQGLREPVAFGYAEDLAREGVALAPGDIATWMSLGEVWERTFRFDEAFTLYARLTGQAVPADAPELGLSVEEGVFRRRSAPFVRMGRILERFGLVAEAATQHEAALALADGDPVAALARGESLVALGRPAEAAELLARSLGFHTSRNSAAALRHGAALGAAWLRAGDFPKALAAYRDVQRAAGGEAGGLEGCCGEVAALYLSGDFDAAYAAVEEGIQTFGTNWRLIYLRGVTGGALGMPAGEVVRDLRAAAGASAFDAAPALAAEAFWLDRLGERDAARERLASALEIEPRLPYAVYLRGRWAHRDGDLEGAREDFRSLIGLSSSCAAALGELGWLLHEEGRFAVAEVALRRAQQEAPSWRQISLRRGLNLLAAGQPEDARLALERAAGGSLDASVRNALAWASYLEGDVDGAVAEYALLQDALADAEDPQTVHAALWQRRVAEHAALVRWVDRFDGRMPRPEWDVQSEARNGVEPRVEDGVLRIRGAHRKAGESLTRAFRKLRALDFRALDAEFVLGAEQRGEGGVMISLENRRGTPTWQFRVYRGSEGRLWWMTQKATAEPERGEVPRGAATGVPVPVRFELDREQNPPVLTVTVADAVVYAEPVTTLRSPTGDLVVSVFARTLNALPVDVSLDNLELVYAQQ